MQKSATLALRPALSLCCTQPVHPLLSYPLSFFMWSLVIPLAFYNSGCHSISNMQSLFRVILSTSPVLFHFLLPLIFSKATECLFCVVVNLISGLKLTSNPFPTQALKSKWLWIASLQLTHPMIWSCLKKNNWSCCFRDPIPHFNLNFSLARAKT